MERSGTLDTGIKTIWSLKATHKNMPQSLVKIIVHVVFSTKDRVDLISPAIETELFKYISGILERNGGRLIIGNGTANHIHLLISIGRIDISDLIGQIKRDTSLWIKNDFPSTVISIGNADMEHFQSGNHR